MNCSPIWSSIPICSDSENLISTSCRCRKLVGTNYQGDSSNSRKVRTRNLIKRFIPNLLVPTSSESALFHLAG